MDDQKLISANPKDEEWAKWLSDPRITIVELVPASMFCVIESLKVPWVGPLTAEERAQMGHDWEAANGRLS